MAYSGYKVWSLLGMYLTPGYFQQHAGLVLQWLETQIGVQQIGV